MKALTINFAPRTLARCVHGLSPWAWLLLVSGVLFVAAAGWRLVALQEQESHVRAVLAGARARLASRPEAERRVAMPLLTPTQSGVINVAVQQLNIPWAGLLDALEAAALPRVALLEIVPDASARRLRGVAEARSAEDMLSYIERLRGQQAFSLVLLSSHQMNEAERAKVLRFEFVATWREF